MSYGPVNRKTLASVNRVNRQTQDFNIQSTGGAVSGKNGKWTCPECNKTNFAEPSSFSQSVQCARCGARFDLQNWSGKDSDLQEPQDPGESNDARELSLEEWLDQKRGIAWNQYKTLDPGKKMELRNQYLKENPA